MDELIERLREIQELDLPNGAKGAVWISDVIFIVEEYFKGE